MQIIDPTYITEATLVYTDIPEADDDTEEWDATKNYVTGQRCVVNTGGYHALYECLWHTPDCLNKFPPDYLAAVGGYVYWMKVSATNRWKLFDMIVAPDRATMGTNTVPPVWASGNVWMPNTVWDQTSMSSMTVSVTPGTIDTIALMNIDCTSINILVHDPVAGYVYQETKIPTLAAYYNAIYTDIPDYPNATVTVIIINTGGEVKVGELIFGKAKTIGTALYGVDVGLVDYSQKTADAFGNFSITERTYSKRLNVNFSMALATHAGVLRILEKYRSVPLVWIISGDYSTTLIYGFYRDLQIAVPNMKLAQGSVSIEGLGGDYVYVTPPDDDWIEPWDGVHRLNIPWTYLSQEDAELYNGAGAHCFVLTVSNTVVVTAEETPVAPSDIALAVPPAPVLAVTARGYLTLGTCTISHANPGVVTKSGHGLSEDQMCQFTTTGALPEPLVASHIYYVHYLDANTFELSMTTGGASLETTTDGSGTHTLIFVT